MSVKRDATSEWMKQIDGEISDHWGQKLPKSGGGMFGNQSTFGFLTQTAGNLLPRIPTVGGMSIGLGPDTLDQLANQGKGILANTIMGGIFRQDQIELVRDRYNQVLEKNGYLSFQYSEDEFLYPLILPFYENPKITETRKSNYAVNKIMNRSEPIRLWTGADPRTIKVDFKLTLPHLAEFAILRGSEQLEEYTFNTRVTGWNDVSRETLKGLAPPESARSLGEPNILDKAQNGIRSVVGKVYEVSRDIESAVESALPDFLKQRDMSPDHSPNESDGETLELYTAHMLDIIRSAVVGSVGSNYLTKQAGPPLVTLNFGLSYKDLKCIVKNYSIKFDGQNGYTNTSLLPRVIDISLTLESYNQALQEGEFFEGGALSPAEGWDSILKPRGG